MPCRGQTEGTNSLISSPEGTNSLMSPPHSSHLHFEPLSCSGTVCGTQLGQQIHVVLTGVFCQVFCKVGEDCWAAVIKEVLMLPGKQIPCNSLPFLGQEPLLWQGTSNLRCGREGTKRHTGVLVGAATQQDFWLKERNILSSGTPKLSILNYFTFAYTNIEIPSLSP